MTFLVFISQMSLCHLCVAEPDPAPHAPESLADNAALPHVHAQPVLVPQMLSLLPQELATDLTFHLPGDQGALAEGNVHALILGLAMGDL